MLSDPLLDFLASVILFIGLDGLKVYRFDGKGMMFSTYNHHLAVIIFTRFLHDFSLIY